MFFNKATRIFSHLAFNLKNQLKSSFKLFQKRIKPKIYSKILLSNIFILLTTNNIQLNQKKIKKQFDFKEIVKTQVCNSNQIKQGNIHHITVPDNDKTTSIVIIRYKKKLYAIGGVCTYDSSVELKDGICFNDKLYCPKHGCAYDIQSGRVELTPAIDDLPKFFVQQNNGKVYVYTPKSVPKKIQPKFQYRDYTDMRKVVIIGSGAAAFGCIQGLRQNGYNGQITVITQQFQFPYDKTKLTKSIKDIDYNDIILRPKSFYQKSGINFLFGRSVQQIHTKHTFPYLTLQDGTKIEYDGLLIASGTGQRVKSIPGITDSQKTYYLRNMDDHKKLRSKLQKVKSILVLGCSPISLQFCSTVKRQYPHMQIKVIDQNKITKLENSFGQMISKAIIQNSFKQGDIEFYNNIKIDRAYQNNNKLTVNLSEGYQISSDIAVLFPNNQFALTSFVENSHYLDLEQDSTNRIKVDVNCRSDNKKIFSAGNCSSIQYFVSRQRIPCQQWNVAYHEGYTAAYNLLALNIPYHQIPFYTFEHFGKTLQFVGFNKFYNQVHIIGDIESWNFIALYSNFEDIVGVAATPSQKNAANIFCEAFRLQLVPQLGDFKKDKWTLETVEKVIRKINKSGCYKDPIYDIKDNYVMSQIIWVHRDTQNYARDPTSDQGYIPGRVDEKGFYKSND